MNVTTLATLIGSLAGLFTAVTVLIATVKNGQKITQVAEKTTDTHNLVNSRMTDALRRINQLANTIAQAGITIPDDPSVKEPDEK